MNRLNPEMLMQLQSTDHLDPEDIVVGLGILFEHGRSLNDIKYIEKGLSLGKDKDLQDFYLVQIETFHFNMANGWSYLDGIKRPKNHLEISEFQTEELEQQIIHLRLALSCSEELPPGTRKSEVLTNLGNLFNSIGRFSESLGYYREALAITPGFGQTLANHSNTVFGYSRLLYDGGHQVYFLKNAYDKLGEALTTEIYKETRSNANMMRENIKSIFKNNELAHDYKERSFDLGNSKEEVAYRKWSLREVLFLNPLNDLTKESIAAQDCLHLPGMNSKDNKPEFFQILFNQIKQEFVTARYQYYESISSTSSHFSDKDNLQLDFSKGISYGMSIEKIKISFKTCYSILDKIAYLLNDYLDLGWKLHLVSFRRIWYTNKKVSGFRVLDKINATENWAFRGLFWLNKDFYETSIPYVSSISPESKELARIRNYMEHKAINVIISGMEISEEDDEKSYWITRKDLEKKTLVLLQTVRAALIYLSLGINLQEAKKNIDGPVIPIYPSIIDDNLKK